MEVRCRVTFVIGRRTIADDDQGRDQAWLTSRSTFLPASLRKVISRVWPTGSALRMSPSRARVCGDPPSSDRVTIDLLGCPTFDSKNTTSLTVPRAFNRDPSETGPLDRVTGTLPWGAKAAFPLRSSISAFRPNIAEMDSRMSDMNSPSTVVNEPNRTI